MPESNSHTDPSKGKRCKPILCPTAMAEISTLIAISLSEGRSDQEVRTVINLLSLTVQTLSTMLNQRQCTEPDLVIPLD